eukprot:scaffold215421_cov19-Tisochrysis_lutea.AAC.1
MQELLTLALMHLSLLCLQCSQCTGGPVGDFLYMPKWQGMHDSARPCHRSKAHDNNISCVSATL